MLSLEPFSEDQGRSAVQPVRDPANQLPCALRVYWPVDSHTRCKLLSPCFKTGRMGSSQADARSAQVHGALRTARAASHDRGDDVSTGILPGLGPPPHSASVHALSRSTDRLVTVPHPTEAHRQSPSASLPTISSTL
ncbi:hypothetical protein LWI29_027571 [Acer saccharum]|uniref:Uncharacterized protein n=1 Tax=Acer saccharum TaxID=4024 RepID=A0AA39SAH2_ACESA|nr:hypothetical protein LWI29_027571 [Acer saccharum]